MLEEIIVVSGTTVLTSLVWRFAINPLLDRHSTKGVFVEPKKPQHPPRVPASFRAHKHG